MKGYTQKQTFLNKMAYLGDFHSKKKKINAYSYLLNYIIIFVFNKM